MAREKLTAEELEQIMAAQPVPIDPKATAASSTFVRLLSSLDRHITEEMMVEQEYAAGEVLFREGDIGDALYLIWSGRVAVVKGKFMNPTVVIYRGPGEVVGEMALLESKPRSASIVALDNVRLLRIGRDGFYELVKSEPAISTNILASLSARLRDAQQISSVSTKIGRQLSAELSDLQTANEQLLNLQRQQQEISDLIIHDLRNPLGNMYTALHMLELTLPKDVLEDNRELIDIAKLSYSRMKSLLESLLDVARMESSNLQLESVTTDMTMLVREIATMSTFSMERRNINLSVDLPPEAPLIVVDEERLRRVLTNLVENAVKYTPRDGRIVIAVEVKSDEIQVSVTDNGPGVPVEDRERVFQRFAQVETGKLRPRGFGLGLAFCKMAVEAHGGRIWVEPGEGGEGSRFVFALPLSLKALETAV